VLEVIIYVSAGCIREVFLNILCHCLVWSEGAVLLERFALLELRYGKTCGFMGTSLWERYALLELRYRNATRYGKTCGFMGTALFFLPKVIQNALHESV
jgi:hypothetical protein